MLLSVMQIILLISHKIYLQHFGFFLGFFWLSYLSILHVTDVSNIYVEVMAA